MPSSRLKEGDTVILHAKVQFNVDEEDDVVHANISHYRMVLPLQEVRGVYARKFDVGDRVIARGIFLGEVAAVHGDYVWVKQGDDFQTRRATDLDRLEVDPPLPPPEQPPMISPPPAPDHEELEQ